MQRLDTRAKDDATRIFCRDLTAMCVRWFGFSSGSPAAAQPINVNIYLPGAASGGKGVPAVPKTASLAAKQAKEGAALRLQLKAQDEQIRKLLARTKPKQAATQLSNAQKVQSVLSSAVSDLSSRLHVQNPIKLAAQLGVANPVNTQEPAAAGKAVAAKNAAAAQNGRASSSTSVAKETPAQVAAAKAAHLKKVEEIDGLLLKANAKTAKLKSTPSTSADASKARTQVLADRSASEQMAAAEEREDEVRHHKQLVQEMNGRVPVRRSVARGQALDQQESNSFFQRGGVRLPGGQASKLKHDFRSQMYALDKAAGDAESMKITGSISDIIPQALFHAMNRQNAIHAMTHSRPKHKGFPARSDSERVFGHSVQGQVKLPSDQDVIKENNRMLSGLEMAAGYKSPSVVKSSNTGDGWGEDYHRHNHGWSSRRWLGTAAARHGDDASRADAAFDDGSDIPVLHDGWGEHDYADAKSKPVQQGLSGWKNQLKSSEQSLGFKGLMAKQRGGATRHSELRDVEEASRDGWLR